MIRYLMAAAAVFFLAAASAPSKTETLQIPTEINFPSSAGEVVFHHQMHMKDLSIKCAQCHHEINAKKLSTPHPDYFKSTSIKCEICHHESEKIKQKAFVCSECHRTNSANIADETLSAKVVIHKQCWNCHPVGTAKEASNGCEKCHSGKKRVDK